jgi:hypothetical protein
MGLPPVTKSWRSCSARRLCAQTRTERPLQSRKSSPERSTTRSRGRCISTLLMARRRRSPVEKSSSPRRSTMDRRPWCSVVMDRWGEEVIFGAFTEAVTARKGPQHCTGGMLRKECRGRPGAGDQPGDGSQPRDGLTYGQHRAIREKEHTCRRARPILGPKIHMPQIVTSKVRSADTRRNSRQFTLPAAGPQHGGGLAGLRSGQAGQAQVRGAEVTDPLVTVRSGGAIQHLGGHVGDAPA